MAYVNLRLSVGQIRRLWDACEVAEQACASYLEVYHGHQHEVCRKVIEGARHDYADLQTRIGDALDTYHPFQPEGGPTDVEGVGEGRGGL